MSLIIKRIISFALVSVFMLANSAFAINNSVREEYFDLLESIEQSELVAWHNQNDNADLSLITNMYGRGGQSVMLHANGYGETSSSSGVTVGGISDSEVYESNDSYYVKANIYVPENEYASLRIEAGASYTEGSAAKKLGAQQFMDPSGQNRKNITTSTSNYYIQNGWNSVAFHLNRDNAAQYTARLYVNGVCSFNKAVVKIDEGTPLEKIYLRFSFADTEDNADREIDAWVVVDDAAVVKGVDANNYVLGLSADLKSVEYEVSGDAVTRIPDNLTVGEVLGNLEGHSVSIVKINEDKTTEVLNDDAPIKEATNIISLTRGEGIRLYDIGLAKTVNGVVIPTEDYVQPEFDSLAWETDSQIASSNDGDVLFSAVDGTVVTGDSSSPYTVGGFWHLNFTDSLNVSKQNGAYRIKSETAGTPLQIRGQGANLDAEKMQKGKYSVVEFGFKAEDKAYFNVGFRWNVGGTVMTDETVLGSLYKTENLTFNSDGYVYIGGCRDSFEVGQAKRLCAWEPQKSYELSILLEHKTDSITVKAVYINGEKLAEDIEFKAVKEGITHLTEIDLYMMPKNSASTYDISISGMKCYTTDEFVLSPKVSDEETLISFDGKSFIMLDAVDGEYYVLAEDMYKKEKYDSNPDRNHEILASSVFNTEDIHNMGYKLNNVYLDGSNEALPSVLYGYISEHKYDGVSSKISLLSLEELNKYAAKIGGNDDEGYWWLRSPQSKNSLWCVSNKNARMVIPRYAHASMYVRPAFYLKKTFFADVKLNEIGKEAAKLLEKQFKREELLELYSEEELDLYFERPSVNITSIDGKTIVGQTLTVKYDWIGDYEEQGSQYLWYKADSPDGEYTLIEGESKRELVLTEALTGKYIKAVIIPKSNSNINPEGNRVMSSMSTTVIYNQLMLDDMLKEIENTDADKLFGVLEKYNDFNSLDLNLTEGIKPASMEILAKESFSSPDDLRDKYNASVVLAIFNSASIEDIENVFKNTDLMLDLTYFNRLEETEKQQVVKSLYDMQIKSLSEFKAKLLEQICVKEFSGASRSELFTLLSDYDSILNAEISSLNEHRRHLAAAMLEGQYVDFNTLNMAVINAVNEAGKSQSSTNSTPSIGGGGGGGGSGSSVVGSFGNNKTPTAIPQTSIYSDLATVPWAVPMIEELTQKGIVSGTGNGMFSPNNNVKREEFVKMIAIGFGFAEGAAAEFADVKQDMWYAPYIAKAVTAGAVSGYDDGSFGIGNDITREDMAVMLYRVIKDRLTVGEAADFSDSHLISDYAKEAIDAMHNAGIITGDNGKVDPKANATRAQAAVMVQRAMAITED